MFSPVKEMVKNIKKEKGLFFSSILSLTILFTLFNLFVFGIFNFNDIKSKLENFNQAIIYVNTMTNEEIETFQTDLYKINGVNALRYVSKESALEMLENELGVDLSEEENPLLDSFYVYVDRTVNAENLKANLLADNRIIELDMRSEMIDSINKFSYQLDKFLLFGGIGVLLSLMVLISNTSSLSVKIRRNEIRDLVSQGVSGRKIKFAFFLEGVILILISTGLGFSLFYIIHKVVIEGITAVNIGGMLRSLMIDTVLYITLQDKILIYLFSLIFGLFIVFYLNYFGMYYFYKKKKNKYSDNVKEQYQDKIINNEEKEAENVSDIDSVPSEASTDIINNESEEKYEPPVYTEYSESTDFKSKSINIDEDSEQNN